jgi:hypothetical protein
VKRAKADRRKIMPTVFPSKDEVHNKVDQAIAQLIEKDAYLLKIDANERAISHRLGLYLQLLFEDWNVDCEYNRDLDNPKRLKTYMGFFDADQRVWNIAETDPITVFPDIIAHKRGTHDNLLIIEIKKTTSKISSDFDYFKLKEFKYQYGYKHALFLKIITGCQEIGIEKKDYLPDKP